MQMKLTGLKSGTPVQRFHNAFVICQACSHKMTEEGPRYIIDVFSFFSFSRALPLSLFINSTLTIIRPSS